MNTDESLSNVFDVEHVEQPKGELVVQTGEVVTSDRIESDYDKTRNNLHSLIDQGKEALEHALSVAKQSEHPRAFEVVGALIKQLADVNQQLMDVHQQKKKLEEPAKGSAGTGKVTNNAIFVGSTAELSNMIKKMSGE